MIARHIPEMSAIIGATITLKAWAPTPARAAEDQFCVSLGSMAGLAQIVMHMAKLHHAPSGADLDDLARSRFCGPEHWTDLIMYSQKKFPPHDVVSAARLIMAGLRSTDQHQTTGCKRVATLPGIVGMLALTLGLLGAATSENPRVGRWKMNIAKSRFNDGPPPKSEVQVCQRIDANTIKLTIIRVDAQGQERWRAYTAHYDGKDYPFPGSPWDTIAQAHRSVQKRSNLQKG